MKLVRRLMVVVGTVLMSVTMLVVFEDSLPSFGDATSALPPVVTTPLNVVLITTDVLPATSLWAIGVRSILVMQGGDVALLSPLGVALLYFAYPAWYWFRSKRRRPTQTADDKPSP